MTHEGDGLIVAYPHQITPLSLTSVLVHGKILATRGLRQGDRSIFTFSLSYDYG